MTRADGDARTVRPATGPTGAVTSVARLGRTLYVLAGEELWQTDVSALTAPRLSLIFNFGVGVSDPG